MGKVNVKAVRRGEIEELEEELTTEGADDTDEEAAEAEAAEAEVEPVALRSVSVSAPMVLEVSGYVGRHVEARLTAKQGEALKKLLEGLKAEFARVEGGRAVSSTADAVRWLLERLGEEMGGE